MSSHNVETDACDLLFDDSRSATDCSQRYCTGGNTVQEGTPGPRLAPKATAATTTALDQLQELLRRRRRSQQRS